MWNKQKNIFDEHHAQLPVVDSGYQDVYRIYYSTRIDKKSCPLYIDVCKKTYNVVDRAPKPILLHGNRGTFDWSGVMPTEIITYKGVKYLYYIGWSQRLDVPYHNNLGLAVSNDDGKTWKKYSDGPVFHTSHKEPGYIGTVGILIENDVWKMWYLSCRNWIEYEGQQEPIYDIKYATSSNGIDWEPTNITAINLMGDEGGISAARVIKKDIYYMWFSVRNKVNYRSNPDDSYRIKMATSTDGINWIRDLNPVLDLSKSGWDSEMICYPYIVSEDEEYKNMIMFYNGNGFGKTGIGYATNK
jgi:hypothetical protein